jgi:hypothetical protein
VSEKFREAVKATAEQKQIPIYQFQHKERKDDGANDFRRKRGVRDQIVFIGVAQERAQAFRSPSWVPSRIELKVPWRSHVPRWPVDRNSVVHVALLVALASVETSRYLVVACSCGRYTVAANIVTLSLESLLFGIWIVGLKTESEVAQVRAGRET